MRKALIVGINYYEKADSLHGCVKDAYSVNAMLERDADGSLNFHTRMLTATGPGQEVKRASLRDAIQELFAGDSEIALLYFAGHGYVEATGGYLCTSDTEVGDDGISLADVMIWGECIGRPEQSDHSRQLSQRGRWQEPHRARGRNQRRRDDPHGLD
jgi:hypothetical protein